MPSVKGRVRREQLIDAAQQLLGDRPLAEISLAQIADAAGMPTSSAYHFFANVQAVFAELAKRFGTELNEGLTAPYETDSTESWQRVYAAAIDRGVAIYRSNPAYCQLILGPHTPPAVKLSDRQNDARLGGLFVRVLNRHFVLPEIPGIDEKMFYSIEIVDLFLSLSYIYHQEIREHMVMEAKEAATAYLERYLPRILPRRSC